MAEVQRGIDLLAKAKRWREVESISHDSVQNVAELLGRCSRFLLEHETLSAADCTHTVFDSYIDWWMDSKPTFKLAIAEDNTLETLYKYLTQMYDLGIPLTIAEKCSPQIRFVQDVEIWGTKEETIRADELLHPRKQFTRLLGQVMGEIYPGNQFLDMVAFDSTGVSRTKGVMKTSIRLVWPDIVVDKDRALRIRDLFVHKFKDSREEEIRAVGDGLAELHKDNHWSTVFNDSMYSGRLGIRMPFCDRVSPAPLKKPERRPLRPVGVFRFSYRESEVEGVESIHEQDGLQGLDWLKIGCVRVDAGTPPTEWSGIQWKGERAPRSCMAFASLQSRSPSSAVKIRTKSRYSGYEARSRNPAKPSPQTASDVMQKERVFEGTALEFKQRLQEQLGAHAGDNIVLDGDGVAYKGDNDSSRIHFKAKNRTVTVSGKPHQVRSLLVAIASFVKEAGGSTRSATGHGRSEHGGSAARCFAPGGSAAGGRACAPSTVYAPSAVYAASAVSSHAAAGQGGMAWAEPLKRVVVRPFEPQSSNELKLSVDEQVTIQHDPDAVLRNIHRWVYGASEATQERGWFPLSHTAPLQVQAPPLQEAKS